MAHSLDVPYFQKRISLLADGLTARFEELEYRDFPNKAPEGVIQLFKSILSLVSSQIALADEKTLPLLHELLSHYQQLLSYLDNSHTEQTPRGIISIIEDLLGRFNPNAQFIASPQSNYNYSIFDIKPYIIEPLRNLLSASDIDSLPSISKEALQIIMFPRMERDNVLLHAVFGHEVGHLYASEYLENEAKGANFNLEVQNKVLAALSVIPIDPSLPQLAQLKRKAEIQSHLMHLRRRAMEELISDYVGVIMFGPSALFAAYEFFSLYGLDALPSGNEAYPPARYRFRFLMEVLNEEGFIGTINKLQSSAGQNSNFFTKTQELFNKIEQIVASDEDINLLKTNPLIDVAYEWVKESLQRAKGEVKALIPTDLVYLSRTFEEEVPELIERLRLNVPPNELGIYPSIRLPAWQSALISSWVYKINEKHFLPDNSTQEFTTVDHHSINKLCLRAIESISLHRAYLKHCST